MKKYILILLLLLDVCAFAQHPTKASFGSLRFEGDHKYTGTISQVISNPYITLNKPGYRVHSFMASIKPEGTADLIGPFEISGDKLSPQVTDALEKMGGKAGILFIDNLKLTNGSGKPFVSDMMMLYYTR